MTQKAQSRASYVTGPDGLVLTVMDLPAPDVRRWSARRKAEIVAAVHGGLIDMDGACGRYGISSEEFLAWDHAYESLGLCGLRASFKPGAPLAHPSPAAC